MMAGVEWWGLDYSQGSDWLLAFLTGHLLVTGLVTSLIYLAAWFFGRRRQRGFLLWARSAALEYPLIVLLYGLWIPLPALFVPRSSDGNPGGAEPVVVMVHGFLCNRAVFWWMRRRLRSAGFKKLFCVGVDPLFHHMWRCEDTLRRELEQIGSAAPGARIVLVGHSMGGVLCRSLMAKQDLSVSVEHLISIGSPHHGTRLARMIGGGETGPTSPWSKWLQRLNEKIGEREPVKHTVVLSVQDQIVVPQESPALPGAEVIRVEGVGHLGMLFSERVIRVVVDRLTA